MQSLNFPDSSFNNNLQNQNIDIEERKEITTQIIGEKILDRDFFSVDPVTLAKSLLGKVLVRKYGENQVIKCRIVETEAYGGDIDQAPKNNRYHSKYSERTKPAWMAGGHIYISFIRGLHHLVHFSADREGEPAVALIRAVEILEGFDLAVQNRSLQNKVSKLGKEVSNGPGKVCAALKIDKKMNGYDATKPGELYIVDQNFNDFNIVVSKRINIDYAGESIHLPWRFYIENNRFISVKGEVLEIIATKSGENEEEDHKNISPQIKEISFLDSFKFGKK